MVWKIVPRGLSLKRYGLEVGVVPNQRPKVFRVNLSELLQPSGHTLRLSALEALRQTIEQVVVRTEVSLWMSPRVLFAKACARQRTFEDIAEIKDVIAARKHRVGHILVHHTKSRAVVKILARRVRLRVEIMHQPRRRKDPVFKTFVVVTVLRIRCQHAIVDPPRQAGPAGPFGSLVVKRIGSNT